MSSLVPLLARLLIAAIFVLSGIGKIAAPDATQAYIASVGTPMPLIAYLIAVLVEVGGGLLLIIGLQTRAVALTLALFALASAVMFHSAFEDQNQLIHFMKNLAIAGGLLQIAATGAGSLSMDARRSRGGERGLMPTSSAKR